MTDHERALAALEEMRVRADAATPGPWSRDHAVGHPGYADGTHDYQVWADGGCVADVGARSARYENGNADFIASVRTDAPKLIAALKAVLEMHAPLETSEDDALCDVCGADHPCPTVRAIAEALGGRDAE